MENTPILKMMNEKPDKEDLDITAPNFSWDWVDDGEITVLDESSIKGI